ncbi:MAG: hypothetical protein AAF291_00785 [Pseudomonadota bacterium]
MELNAKLERIGESRTYRVILAIFGGYVFTVGFFAFFSVALALAGTSRVEAMWWSVLTSFLIYTLIALWAAATVRPLATSAIILGSSAVMIALALPLAAGLG